ncbi:MAG: RNA polymerase sigma-70 factor [Bacteroidota bacterium]
MIPQVDKDWLTLFERDSEKAIDLLFRQYYKFICRVIYRLLPNTATAEDLAQEVFFDLWRKKDKLNVQTSLKAYLRRSAINKSLNYIRDQKMSFEDEAAHPEMRSDQISALQKLEVAELEGRIHQAIERLPERCRLVFMLSRFEDMSYREIAAHLDISIKTVENQISKALKYLQAAIGTQLPKIIVFWILSDVFSFFLG